MTKKNFLSPDIHKLHELNLCLLETYHVDLKMAINIRQMEALFSTRGAKILILIEN